MKDDLNSLINQFDNSLQRSQVLASQANQINRLQTKHLEQCQTTMDKSSKHLQDVEHEINEIERGFCMKLCCTSKTKKTKSKIIGKSQDDLFEFQHDPIYSNNQLQNLDENLQKLEFFNRLIDQELQQQIQTLNNLHYQTDLDSSKLNKANMKTKYL